MWHSNTDPATVGYNLLKLARDCYHKLCPHAPPDLPIEKSSTMQAYVQGAMVHAGRLDRERDIWHDLHTGLNSRLDCYKAGLEYLIEHVGPIDDGVKKQLAKILDGK